MEHTSVSLLQRLRQPSDLAAWDRFVDLYTPLLYHWAHRAGLSADEADNLVQDVFAVLVEKLPEFDYDPTKSFRAWLKTVLLNRWRSWKRHDLVGMQETVPHMETVVPDSVTAFWEEEYRHYLSKRAMELIQEQFQQGTWQAFWETVVQERPAKEVASELGMTVNAVYIARSRVLTCLRQELAGLWE